ncbi:FAD-dependent oxidoreductase [Flammeovirga sp. SubArs3]|uniref:protoporphyrinogen/coproporphyrinogen oxidase n=1 Tax=Flammeovirga sp. SubArs3 TaxID=2995316 RepID=UPI00248C0973|nr:FAD-dependent oxidoreductase [Flammeovirga sp. SubArs3]
MEDKVYIIGAGVSGLIAAYELEQYGYHPIVIEKSSEVGGRVKTLQENGFALDVGFQVLLSAYPLAQKYLDMEKLNLRKLASGALIYSNGQAYRIGDPLRNWNILFPTLLSDIGSIYDKLKILQLNISLKNKSLKDIFNSTEKTTYDYLVDFGFSTKIINRFFKPFFSGIFLEPDLNTSSRMFEFVYKMFGEGHATIPQLGIGEISKQLKGKLKHTEFIYNTEVTEMTNDFITLGSGEKKSHQGVIIASNTPSLINQEEVKWKSCMCIYFEVDQTNIPQETIALIADTEKFANNLYAYRDHSTNKTILSVTSLEIKNHTDQEIIDHVTKEVKHYTGASTIKYIKHYRINKALPNRKNLKMTVTEKENRLSENIFIAGDSLLNGSLNAAMESGRNAAIQLINYKKKSLEISQ